MRNRIAPVVVVLLLVVAAGLAQSQRGEITGVVRDVSGSVLPGVTVQARGPASSQQVRSAVTDGRGVYSFKDLSPGPYELTFALAGFDTTVLRVTLGSARMEANASLRVSSLAETVTVTAEAPNSQRQYSAGVAGGVGGGMTARAIPDYRRRTESFGTEAYDHREEN